MANHSRVLTGCACPQIQKQCTFEFGSQIWKNTRLSPRSRKTLTIQMFEIRQTICTTMRSPTREWHIWIIVMEQNTKEFLKFVDCLQVCVPIIPCVGVIWSISIFSLEPCWMLMTNRSVVQIIAAQIRVKSVMPKCAWTVWRRHNYIRDLTHSGLLSEDGPLERNDITMQFTYFLGPL